MRLLHLALVLMLCVPFTYALGVRAPVEFSDTIQLEEGDTLAVPITVVGDANDNEVKFFVLSDHGQHLKVEGKALYQEEFVLDPYEERTVSVVFDLEFAPEDDIVTNVTYGARFLDTSEDAGIAIVQEVSLRKEFELKGDGEGDFVPDEEEEEEETEDNSTDTNSTDTNSTNTDNSDTGTSGSSGGSGGATVSVNTTSESTTADTTDTTGTDTGNTGSTTDSSSGSNQEAAQDVTPQNTAFNTLQANTNPAAQTQTTSSTSGDAQNDNEGILSGGLLVLFSVTALGISVFTYSGVKDGSLEL